MQTKQYLPPNIEHGADALGGLFDTRKLIEAVIALVITIFTLSTILRFLPQILMYAITGFVSVIVFVIFITGVRDMPISQFLVTYFIYKRTNTVALLKKPQPLKTKKKKKRGVE